MLSRFPPAIATPFSRNGSYRSHTAAGSNSGCLRKVVQSCLPRPPLPIKPMRTRSLAPITREALQAVSAPNAKLRRFIGLLKLVQRPGPSRPAVCSHPSRTSKMPGNFFSQPALADGTYSRALASSAEVPGTCAAMPTECTSAAPGQVRSCTHRNMRYFCAAAASSRVSRLPLAGLQRHAGVAHLARQQQRVQAGQRFVDDHGPQLGRFEHGVIAVRRQVARSGLLDVLHALERIGRLDLDLRARNPAGIAHSGSAR